MERDLGALIAAFVGPTTSAAQTPTPPARASDAAEALASQVAGSALSRSAGREDADGEEDLEEAGIRVICFSKDRAFQLAEYLRSLHVFAGGHAPLEVYVLWTASSEALAKLYEEDLPADFPWVTFWRETDFAQDLEDIVTAPGSRAVLFGVDDAVFIRRFDLDAALRALCRDARLAAFHLKLARGMTYCQPADRAMREPAEEQFRSLEDGALWSFPLGAGTYDWSYPWDLCGSMYRRSDVVRMLQTLTPEERAHPNLLEMNGAKQVSTFFGHGRRAACFAGDQIMVVVTVNRVQDHFHNAVYSEDHGDGQDEEDMEDFNPLYGTHQFDLGAFAARKFDRVHIGYFAMQETLDVSVLLPFKDARDHVSSALESICDQDAFDLHETAPRVELLLIDDHSQDGGAEVVEALLAAKSAGRFAWRILRTASGRGVAAALNTGLAAARGRVLMRMDADDVTSLTRMRRQLCALEKRPALAVLGSGAYMVKAAPSQWKPAFADIEASGVPLRRARAPVGTALLRWHLFFACELVHPTVAMRRRVLMHLRGYDTSSEAEDYDLWLRCIDKGYEVDNMEDTLHALRIAPTSVSGRRSLQESRRIQAETARRAWVRAGFLGPTVGLDAVHALLFGEPAPSLATIKALIEAIEKLEAFVGGESPPLEIREATDDRIKSLAVLTRDEALWRLLEASRGISQLACLRALASRSQGKA